jgi:hypothetical protein
MTSAPPARLPSDNSRHTPIAQCGGWGRSHVRPRPSGRADHNNGAQAQGRWRSGAGIAAMHASSGTVTFRPPATTVVSIPSRLVAGIPFVSKMVIGMR